MTTRKFPLNFIGTNFLPPTYLRESFTMYQINQLDTAIITNATNDGNNLTYFGSNKFAIGQTVTITGMLPIEYNITGTIATRTNSQFTIAKNKITTATATNGADQTVLTVANSIGITANQLVTGTGIVNETKVKSNYNYFSGIFVPINNPTNSSWVSGGEVTFSFVNTFSNTTQGGQAKLVYNGSQVSDKIQTICQSATAGTSIVTVADKTGIEIGQFVTGVNIPTLNSQGEPTKVIAIANNSNQITLNSKINQNIINLNIYFFDKNIGQNNIEYMVHHMAGSGNESVRTSMMWKDFEPNAPTIVNGILTHSINWNNATFPLEKYLQLASERGIQVMPRFGSPPNWAMDWDYFIDNNNIFSFNDPETKTQLKNKGVKVYATGNVGDSFIIVNDLKRGCLLLPNMVITGDNIPNNCKITSVTQIANTRLVSIDPNEPKKITVTDGSFFSSGRGEFKIYIDDEIITITSRSGNVLTAKYPVLKSHLNGSLVTSYDPTDRLTKNNSWKIGLNQPLSQILDNYVIGSIQDYELNNVINGKSKKIDINQNDVFKFNSVKDVAIFLINLKRKGGSLPSDYYDFAAFMNIFLTKFGTNGTFWTELNNTVNSITSAISNVNKNAYSQTINLTFNSSYPTTSNIVVGMTIESDAFGSVPSTAQDGNNSYIPPDARICSINGNQITIDKPLNKSMPAGVSVKLNFPKMINYQIWNECDSAAYGGKNYPADFKFQIGNNNKIHTIKRTGISRGANWPFHPRQLSLTTNRNLKIKTSIKDYSYGFEFSFLDFVQTVKKEMHDVDSKANAVSNAVTQPNKTYPRLLAVKNGKYAYDKFGVNKYPGYATDLIDQFVTLKNLFIKPQYYGIPTANNLTFPNLILSEYGYSTDKMAINSAKTESLQNGYIDTFMSWPDLNSNDYQASFRKLIDFNQNTFWKIENAMYFNWASNETAYAVPSSVSNDDSGTNNVRGIYRYKNPALKTGSITINKGDTFATTTSVVPSSWTQGTIIYKLFGEDTSDLSNFPKTILPNGSESGLEIDSISANKKTIYFKMPYSTSSNILINSANVNNGIVTYVTRSPHFLITGQRVTIKNIIGGTNFNINELPITVTGDSNTTTFTIPISAFENNPPSGSVNQNTGTISKITNYTFPYLVINKSSNPPTFQNFTSNLTPGKTIRNRSKKSPYNYTTIKTTNQKILYSKTNLEKSIKIDKITYKDSTTVMFTTVSDHNIKSYLDFDPKLITGTHTMGFDTTLIVGIQNSDGSISNKFNGLFLINKLNVTNTTFYIDSFENVTKTEIDNLILTNAEIQLSIQPKLVAQTYQDQALNYQGRT